jgi:transposase
MKQYTEEFKKTIVELYEAGNKTKTELAREYGTAESNVRAWIKKYGKIRTSTGEITTNDEILKLQKENQEIKTENEILKKALAIFSKQQKIK